MSLTRMIALILLLIAILAGYLWAITQWTLGGGGSS